MIKAIIFFWLFMPKTGEIVYANMAPVDNCDGKTVSAFIEKLPDVPKDFQLGYYCEQPGPADTVTSL